MANTYREIPVIKMVPKKAYARITQNIPIFTVDVVIKTKDGVLLGQRLNNPAKGFHFTIGSRMFKGEVSFEDVAIRTAHEEAGARHFGDKNTLSIILTSRCSSDTIL